MKTIELTRDKVATVDDVDYEWLNQWKWCAEIHHGNWYAKRTHRQRSLLMHRVILGRAAIGRFGDHRNGNTLDNRRQNLRPASPVQSAHNRKTPSTNSSGIRGITWEKDRQKWKAAITAHGRTYNLGRFDSKTEAGLAYKHAAEVLHGEFRRD